MGALGWIISIVGTVGVAGFVALLFFAPAFAALVSRIVGGLFRAVISSRIGCATLAGIVCGVVGLFYGDNEGAARVKAEWDAAEQVAIENGRGAHDKAEKEIPPLDLTVADPAPVDLTPSTTPAPHHFKLPTWFPSKAKNDCVLPKATAPRRAAARATDPGLRNDPFNRDNH